MESYIVKVIKRLRKEVPRRFKELRNLCDELLVSLGQGEKTNVVDVMSNDGTKYLQALILSCETHHPRLTEIALDAFHYFIEHGYLKGSTTVESTTTSSENSGHTFVISGKQIMDKVIDTISKCSDEYDEAVQLQVIKALLTAITSLHCEVHDASLLLSVRACFHIHLMSRNQAIKVAAKAALTQMVSVINQRMELNDTQTKAQSTNESSISNNSDQSTGGTEITSNQVIGGGIINSGSLDENAENHSSQINDTIINESDQHLVDFSNLPVNTSNVLDVGIADKDANDQANSNDNKSQTREEQPETNENTLKNEGMEITNRDSETNANTTSASNNDFLSIYHRDAYLLFRALCKLSMKGVADDNQAGYSDNIVLQNKLLSLELIYHLLNNCGPAFRYGQRFIYAIRTFLCVSLLNNCTSQVAQVTGLSLQIFVLLIQNFKEHLKGEVEVFVSTIFLRILESENSTFEHKLRVLEVFHSIVKDPMGQIELFINYDCDLDAINLFSRIVNAFSKISKNPVIAGSLSNRIAVEFMSSNSKRSQQEELQIRSMGLEGLVIILRSLVVAAGLSNAANYNLNNSSSNSTTNKNIAALANNADEPVHEKEEGDETTSSTPVPNESQTTNNNQNNLSSPSVDTSSNANNNSNSSNFNAVEVFDKKLKLQQEIDTGIIKFNLNPMKGIKYLVSLQHLTLDPVVVAKFLLEYQDRLDKTAVGDLLGREKDYEGGFCYRVLHEYVEQLDFSAMEFDRAMRLFLSGFRLPGEAQKIDRIMEKFAERYYLQHQDEFASADMAFILAFSTIMLQTNLHNPAVREDKRMTKEQFIKQNKGISSDGELSDELLSNIYDRIAAEPFTLNGDNATGAKKGKYNTAAGSKDDSSSSFIVFQGLSERKKKDAFNHERKEMVKMGEEMIRQTRKRNSLFIKNNSPEKVEQYIRAMFEIVWPSALAVFSQILETFDDAVLIQQCILGFQLAILLACRLDYNIARNTFINALYKFTTLDSVREMKSKNIACIKLILTIALSEGEYLEESWTQVLTNISQLSRLLLFASGIHSDELYFNSEHGQGNNSRRNSQMTRASSEHFSGSNSHNSALLTGSGYHRSSFNSSASTASMTGSINSAGNNSAGALDPFTKLFMGPSKAEVNRLVEENNADLIVRDIDPLLIDKIYQNSVALSGPAIVHFVTSLCEVSMQEISSSSTMNALRSTANNSDNSSLGHSHAGNNPTAGAYGANSSSARVFSLQKLVEVADCNMNIRSRMEWSKIWNLLNNHFSIIGVSDNLLLSMYAIDSLKQLSIKFLQKDELSNFNFQRIFLKPFEKIIQKSRSSDTKDLVLRCINIMIKTCANNIRSGWRSIFNIFTIAAQQEDSEIAKLAFDITEQLMNEQFSLLVFDFIELMNCLVSFSSSALHTSLSLRALSYLLHCADHLAAGIVPATGGAADAQHLVHDIIQSNNNSSNSGNINHALEKKIITISNNNLTGEHTNNTSNNSNNSSQTLSGQWSVSVSSNAPMVVDDDHAVFRLWWPLLLGLSTRVSDVRLAVRLKALDTLQTILKKHGQLFSSQAWLVIFKGILFPMMDSAKTDSTEQPRSGWPTVNPPMATNKESWIGTMALSVLNTCVELYQMFRENEQTLLLLPDLLRMIQDCILQETESLARMGARVLRDLIFSVGHHTAVLDEELLLLDKSHVDHIVRALCVSLTQNLCRDFQDAGRIAVYSAGNTLLGELPVREDDEEQSTSSVDECPLAVRRRNKSTTINQQTTTSTAALMRQDSNSSVTAGHSKELATNWTEFGGAVMTCLVLSLDLIKIISETTLKYKHTLQVEHYKLLLGALELSHWHAFYFNENINLRLKLQQRNFMNKNSASKSQQQQQGNKMQNNYNEKLNRTLPHLLDQEVLSLETMLHIVFQLYTIDSDQKLPALGNLHLQQSPNTDYSISLARFQEKQEFIAPWLEKYASVALIRYLSLEEQEDSAGQSDNSDADVSEDETQLQLQPNHKHSRGATGVNNSSAGGSSNSNNSNQNTTSNTNNTNNINNTNSITSNNNNYNNKSAVLVDQQFARERHNYYLSPALLVLQHAVNFTSAAFESNRRWLGPLLSRLVQCESKAVRVLVMKILQKFVDPIYARQSR